MKTLYTTIRQSVAALISGMGEPLLSGMVIFSLIFQGCDSFVDTDPPSSQLSGLMVFEDSQTANAAMAGIYISMRDNGILSGSLSGLTYTLGLYADELDNYDSMVTNYFYNNSLFANEGGVLDTWQQSYKQLYAINAVIEGVAGSAALGQGVKNQLTGEAQFLRALIHFHLMNLYGDVPYVNSTDYRINTAISKMTQQEMMAAIIVDLQQAISKLPEAYPDSERIRPNRLAAYALLARVQLYNGDWAGAADAASAVISSAQYAIVSPDQVFLKESTETIWQLMPLGQGNNTSEGSLFIFESGPPPTVALSSVLMGAFEPGDLRKVAWTRMIIDGTGTWYHAFKYKENSNTGDTKEYSVMLRLAEQFLIRAEARAHQGDLTDARQDLNVLRSRAGLGDVEASGQQDLLEAVMQERRIELFTELGHRYFDLKRTGSLDVVLGSVKPGWDTQDSVWPLPAAELSANPNLNPQNPGY